MGVRQQNTTQGLTGVALGGCGDFFWRAVGYDFSAFFTALRPEVYDPVGGFDDVQVVLDDEDGMAGGDEPLEDAEEDSHVVEMQAGGRLIKYEQGRFACRRRNFGNACP
jgi:hypothetical protein